MTKEEKERDKIYKKICDQLYIMSWKELAYLGINAQQAQKIKNGERVRFYGKTFERLRNQFT